MPHTTTGALPANRRRTDYIRLKSSANLHHGIRVAARLGLNLNTFVTINFALTACPEHETSRTFSAIRARFGKWVTRPGKANGRYYAPPTFVWVIENPNGRLHAHWLVHVPAERAHEFSKKLEEWLWAETGDVRDDAAIDIRPAHNPFGLQKYMLKGMHVSQARDYGIAHTYQGFVTDRRIGHSRNVGPVRVAELRRLNVYRRARRWIPGKYQ